MDLTELAIRSLAALVSGDLVELREAARAVVEAALREVAAASRPTVDPPLGREAALSPRRHRPVVDHAGIEAALRADPKRSNCDIAREIGCVHTAVRQIRSRLGIPARSRGGQSAKTVGTVGTVEPPPTQEEEDPVRAARAAKLKEAEEAVREAVARGDILTAEEIWQIARATGVALDVVSRMERDAQPTESVPPRRKAPSTTPEQRHREAGVRLSSLEFGEKRKAGYQAYLARRREERAAAIIAGAQG